MRRLLAWLVRPVRRRVLALVDGRVAASERAWIARLAEVQVLATQECCAAEARMSAAAARLADLARRLDELSDSQNELARAMAQTAAREQALAGSVAHDITAMLHRLEQVRHELRHDIEMTLHADG